jgi:hypothetical protein
LRLNAIEPQMAPIRTDGDFDHLNQNAGDMLHQLLWWTNALKTARESALARAA